MLTKTLRGRSNWLRPAWAAFATALLVSALPLRAAPPQPFLKVNRYYVLYTYPVVPYLNDKGVMMVGLEGFGQALSHRAAPRLNPTPALYTHGTVTTDPAARAETLAFNGYHVTFRAGSEALDADGRRAAMPVAAVWDATTGRMVVPLVSVARALGLDARWDPVRRVMGVTGPPDLTVALDRDEYGGDIRDELTGTQGGVSYGSGPELLVDTGALVPVSARLVRGAGAARGTRFVVAVRNTSGTAMVGQEWVNLFLLCRSIGSRWLDTDNANGRRFQYGPTIPPHGTRTLSVDLYRQIDLRRADLRQAGTPLCVIAYPVGLVSDPALGGNP